ncbi:MAG: HAMP domain-containing histidine kinase [Actinomycetota bacterium]|nr:HAMP domain-containing histidine kinase [Actinomycetota bacterium]
MKHRLVSFRLWLLVAMLVAGAVGLIGARISFERIQQNDERAADRAKDLKMAQAIAAQLEAGITLRDLRIMQSVLPYDQIVVYRAGRRIFAGPRISGTNFELEERSSFPGGRVVVRDYHSATPSSSLELTLVVGAWVLLVIAAAVVTTSMLTKALQAPIDQGVAAADRVAVGDLKARIGAVGPDEFARLASAFDSMVARLEAADRDQREFLADVAHEIATPVNAISGLAGALVDGTLEMPAQRVEAARFIEKETWRLGSLLDDLRRLTHLDFAEVVRQENIDISDLYRSLEARFVPQAAKAGVELRVESDDHNHVTADRRLLETVLDNFVSNAIRYTTAGGSVVVRATRTGENLVLSVADTGGGIAPHDLERIFDRFYRTDRARDRATGGSGLGLAIARRAAQALNAWIEVSSEVGLGSEFSVVLPPRLA